MRCRHRLQESMMEFKPRNLKLVLIFIYVLNSLVPGISGDRAYEMKLGSCFGKDQSKGYDVSLENCAAVCGDTEHCHSFTYLVESRRIISPYRCVIQKHSCDGPTIKKWETLVTYNKQYDQGESPSKSAAASLGFSADVGNCIGYDMNNGLSKNLEECAALCWENKSCLGFSYVTDPNDTKLPCRLKDANCDTLEKEEGEIVLTFRKNLEDGSKYLHQTDVNGYNKKAGVCLKHNLVNLRAGITTCSQKCSDSDDCKSFVYVFKTKKPWPYARCWLKNAVCENTITEEDMVVYTYAKEGKNSDSVVKTSGLGEAKATDSTQEFKNEVEGNFDVSGFERRTGVCLGDNLHNSGDSFRGCAASCAKDSQCQSFVYVFNSTLNWDHPPCWMKSSKCEELVTKQSLKVYTYTKNAPGEAKIRTKKQASVRGFKSYTGTCNSGTIRRIRTRNEATCARRCLAYTKCTRFVYIKRKFRRCHLKTSSCKYRWLNPYRGQFTYYKLTCPSCKNGGKCVKYRCRCKPGYSGNKCQHMKNICLAKNPCKHGKCVLQTGGKYKCVCKSGYMGGLCDKVDKCASSPCRNGGTCRRKANKYTCSCMKGYTGSHCEHSPCAKLSCQNGGSCTVVKGEARCTCAPDYTGTKCESYVDACKSGPCQNGGTCKTLDKGYKCLCSHGYVGNQCEAKVDFCASNPCRNGGSCTNKDKEYQCKCRPGFTGKRCEEDIDECKPKPCNNSGICVDKVNGFECRCQPGFEGTTCNINIDECSSNPCKNAAKCVDKINGYECKCKEGFAGTHCEHTVDYCKTQTCANGGTCNSVKDTFKCICPKGFEGKTCENDVNECLKKPCLNNGGCENTVGSFKCICKPGFMGDTCSVNKNECDGQPCKNGGSCTDAINGFSCQCIAGFTGQTCEVDIDDCAEKPCGEHGVCADQVNGYKCKCNPGFSGDLCEINTDECDSNPCMNGGTCVDGFNGYTCKCTKRYTGSYCDQKVDIKCPEDYCENGGTCVEKNDQIGCVCKEGFTGSTCSDKLITTLAPTTVSSETKHPSLKTKHPNNTSTSSVADSVIQVITTKPEVHTIRISEPSTVKEQLVTVSKSGSDNVTSSTKTPSGLERIVSVEKTVVKTVAKEDQATSKAPVVSKPTPSNTQPPATTKEAKLVTTDAALTELIPKSHPPATTETVKIVTASAASTKTTMKSTPESKGTQSPDSTSRPKVTDKTAIKTEEKSVVGMKSLDYSWDRPVPGGRLDSMEASAFGDVGGLDTRRRLSNGEIGALSAGIATFLLLLGMVIICALDRRRSAGFSNLKAKDQYEPLSLGGDTEEDFEPRNTSNNAARSKRLKQYRPGVLRGEEIAEMLSDSSCEVPDNVTSDEDDYFG